MDKEGRESYESLQYALRLDAERGGSGTILYYLDLPDSQNVHSLLATYQIPYTSFKGVSVAVNLGAKAVPVLIADGKAFLEYAEIVTWIRSHKLPDGAVENVPHPEFLPENRPKK